MCTTSSGRRPECLRHDPDGQVEHDEDRRRPGLCGIGTPSGCGDRPIGQLIFDPQGEYANPNTQDGTELAAIGVGHVVIYKFGGGHAGEENVRPLGINFFDPAQIDAAKAMIADQLAAASADYVQGFVMADFDGTPLEGDTEAEARDRRVAADRGRLLLYGALAKADFTIPQQQLGPSGERYPWRAWVTMRRELADELERQLGTGHLSCRSAA